LRRDLLIQGLLQVGLSFRQLFFLGHVHILPKIQNATVAIARTSTIRFAAVRMMPPNTPMQQRL
jgi:hypothetical protein